MASEPASASLSVVQGIDVSHYQGEVAWHEVAQAGYAFAFVKATQGITSVDPQLEANWNGTSAAGILRGAYHFYEPADDPEQQAEHFLTAVSFGSGALPPTLDIEISGGQSASTICEGIGVWLAKVKDVTGQTPLVYTAPTFWATLNTARFGEYPLWVAEYGVSSPKIPSGWKSWTFWQHSESGTVSGISGSVDLNLFQGTLAQLHALTVVP